MATSKHQTDQGKPAYDRGIPPHKGGYHGRKSKGPKSGTVYFTVGGTVDKPGVKAPSPWNPGKRRKKSM